jgi:ribosome maturation factor RimP
VDRPLTLPRHWRRNVGRLVKVTIRAALPGPRGEQPAGERERQVTGRVVAADDERVVLEIESGRAELTYAQLGPGRVQIEFHRPDEVGDDDLDDDLDGDFGDAEDIDDIDDEDDVEDEER